MLLSKQKLTAKQCILMEQEDTINLEKRRRRGEREGLIQWFPQAILDRVDTWRVSYRRDKPAMAEIQSKLNNDKDLSQSEINDDVPIYAPNI